MIAKPRSVLFLGDAGIETGFARATHHICNWLHGTGWDVRVIGINYTGDPHPYPYPIHPAGLGGDAMGMGRVVELCLEYRPDVLVIQNDPWNVADCVETIEHYNLTAKEKDWDPITTPVVAYMPVDGDNVRHAHWLSGRLALAIWYTEFGRGEAEACGYTGRSAVVPLGVDLAKYYPEDRERIRTPFLAKAGLPPDAFIVGNVNRNQPRKRIDLTMRYFARWAHSTGLAARARLLLHMAPTGDRGIDLRQMAHHYNIGIILTNERGKIGVGVSEHALRHIYNVIDLNLSTTQGEGFGLTTLEAMACMTPCAVPEWSALGDWPEDAAWMIPCTGTAATMAEVNVIGGIADEAEAVKAIDQFYLNPELRAEFGRRGLRLAERPQYRWQNVGRSFAAALDTVVPPRAVAEEELSTC